MHIRTIYATRIVYLIQSELSECNEQIKRFYYVFNANPTHKCSSLEKLDPFPLNYYIVIIYLFLDINKLHVSLS